MALNRNEVQRVFLVLTLTFIAGAASTACPGGAGQIDEGYTIVGDRSNYTGFVWVRPSGDLYVVTCNPSCSPVAGYNATTNTTHSTLTIASVGMRDAGTWSIMDAVAENPAHTDVCKLMVAVTASTPPSIHPSSSSTQTTETDDAGVSPGLIAGIVFTVLFFVLLVIVIVVFFCQQRERRKRYIPRWFGSLCCCRK